MSKGDNRLKILYVLDELKYNSKVKNETDDARFLSATELIDILNNKFQLNADRKSIYSYIDSLIKYGYPIEKSRKGYYLQERYSRDEADECFELAELKMIVDALSASRFISAKKTRSIINKLEKLADEDGKQLKNRRVYLEKAIKSDNSSVIYSIDSIYTAITNNNKISFKYQKIEVDFDAADAKLISVNKKDSENNDKIYTQSPFALVWKNEYYYLLCYDSETNAPKTFRVDKMKDVTVCEDMRREGARFFDEIDISDYANTAFSMFGGEKINIVLRVKNELAGVISDRFGKKISVFRNQEDDGYFRCSVYVQKSQQFYSWLSGFGGDVELIFPHNVRSDYIHYLEGLILSYSNNN